MQGSPENQIPVALADRDVNAMPGDGVDGRPLNVPRGKHFDVR